MILNGGGLVGGLFFGYYLEWDCVVRGKLMILRDVKFLKFEMK